MRIEVIYEEWQMACCGDPFSIGDTVSWSLHSPMPCDTVSHRGLPRYYEDHHDLGDGPACDVAGIVVAISRVSERIIPLPGTRTMTNDPEDIAVEALQTVERFLEDLPGFGADRYEVVLEVDESATLPPPSEPEVTSITDRVRNGAASWASDGGDGIDRALAALAARIESEFGGSIDVLRSTADGGVTLQPRDKRQCAVRWLRDHDGDDDVIQVGVGEGNWNLSVSRAGIAELSAFVDAAAAGRVRELHEPGFLVTRIADESGTLSEHRVPRAPFPGGDVLVTREQLHMLTRKEIDYLPWSRPVD